MTTIYRLNDLFIFGGRTAQNYPYIVVGCLKAADGELFFQGLADKYYSTYFPDNCEPKLLDKLIAKPLISCRRFLQIAGCTIKVPNVSTITGGVMGNPAKTPKSANKAGTEESIGNWRQVTFPGGPGIAVQTTETKEMKKTVKDIELGKFSLDHYPGLNGKEFLLAISKEAFNKNVSRMLALTDGSGKGAQGSALIQEGKNYIVWSLEEV